jgi:nucleolar protein 15
MVKSNNIKEKKSKKALETVLTEKEEIVEEVEEVENTTEEKEEENTNFNRKSRISKLEQNIESMSNTAGVVYIGHLPWGFNDNGIKKYFQQFGKITRIMVPKSRKVFINLYYLDRKSQRLWVCRIRR